MSSFNDTIEILLKIVEKFGKFDLVLENPDNKYGRKKSWQNRSF